MKTVIRVISIMLLACSISHGQAFEIKGGEYSHQIDVVYYNSHIGNQVMASFNYHIKRHAIVGGLQYHFNTVIRKGYSRFDNWELYNLKSNNSPIRVFLDHVGFNIGYEYHLFDRPVNLDPYLFIQTQPTSSIAARISDPANPLLSRREGNYFIIETVGGIGLQKPISQKISLNGSIGAGTATFITDGKLTPSEPDTPFNTNFTERALVYRIGVTYSFKN